MYAMPYPWLMPQMNNHSEMSFKQFIEDIKAFEEWQASKKPKEEKKDDKKPNPDKWDAWDHLTFILFFDSLFIVIGAVLILQEFVQLMKAIPHP